MEDTPAEDVPPMEWESVTVWITHYKLQKSWDFPLLIWITDGLVQYGEGEEMIAVLGHLAVSRKARDGVLRPFGGEIRDGKVLGRGSIDDKGPTITALYALAALRDQQSFLKTPDPHSLWYQ